MAIFNSYVKFPEGKTIENQCEVDPHRLPRDPFFWHHPARTPRWAAAQGAPTPRETETA